MTLDPNSVFVFSVGEIEAKSFYDTKAKKKRYIIKGHIDSSDLDLVNDIVLPEAMDDISRQFSERNIKLDFDHETLLGNTDLEKKVALTKSPLGKRIKETRDQKGNFVEFELNPNWKKLNNQGEVVKTFDEVWEEIEEEHLDAFSIAYIPMETETKNVNGIDARLLKRVNLINVALTGNPINPSANIRDVMVKSVKYLEDNGENKSYEKDGGHAHTENDPLGLHNHPEIEERIAQIQRDFNDRLDWVHERINDINEVSDDAEVSACPGLKSNKRGANMAEDKNINKKGDEPSNPAPSDGTPAEPAQPAEPEGKSADLKSVLAEIKSIGERMSTFEKELKEVKGITEAARPAGHGANPEDLKAARNAGEEIEAKGTLNLI